MFQSYYGMSCNPFIKNNEAKEPYKSNDFIELTNRFNFLKEVKGIGVFCGCSGTGKTYTIRNFINNLNNELYKIIYISATKGISLFDFFKEVGKFLNIDIGACYKTDMYHNIQKEIRYLVDVQKKHPIIIIDDAHNLSKEILLNLKILFEYDINSKDYISLYLIGENELITKIQNDMFTYLRQRIIVNYTTQGLSRTEVKEYVKTRLEIANINYNLFTENAFNALYSCSKTFPRNINTLVLNCLMIGSQLDEKIIDEKIVMDAKGEMDLI